MAYKNNKLSFLVLSLLIGGTTAVYWADQENPELQNKQYHEPSGPSPKGAGYFYSAKRINLDSDVSAQQNIVNALQRKREYFATQSLQNDNMDTWQPVGPNNIGGRTRAMVFSPADANTIYSAGVSGGVFKSVDAGNSWQPVADDLENLAVVTMAIPESQPETIFLGTGEGHYVGRPITRSRGVEGNGIYVSNDAGNTWSPLSFTLNNADFRYVNKLRVNSSNELIAATGTGLWQSSDLGASWQLVLDQNDRTGGCLEVEIHPENEQVMLASCGSFYESAVYRSNDGGSSWQEVLTDFDMGRALMKFAPSQPSTVYLLAAQNEFGEIPHALKGLYRSEDAGLTWSLVTDMNSSNEMNRLIFSNVYTAFSCPNNTYNPNGVFGQGWYSSVLTVDPINPETIWVGGVDLMRSDDGGQNFGLASFWWARDFEPGFAETLADSYAHADQHDLMFHPDYDGVTETRVYSLNDGGVYVSGTPHAELAATPCDPASTQMQWQPLNNGYAVNQFYHGAVSEDGSRIIGGMQDNGTYLSQNGADWVPVGGGDGAYSAFDPTNPNEIYISSQFAFLSRINLVTGALARLDDTINEARPFITPYLIDPNNDERLFLSASSVWRSDNRGGQWTQISIPSYSNVTLDWLSAIAVQPGLANNLIVGSSDGFIYRHDAALTANGNYVMESQQISNGFISSVSYHPFEINNAYTTVSTFGESHIYASTDNGASWQVIDGVGDSAFPDIPAHDIVAAPEDETTLYVGSDLGVYVTRDGGDSWVPMGAGLPNTPVERLILVRQQRQSSLYAFTYGRGAFKLDLSDVENLSPETSGEITPVSLFQGNGLRVDLNGVFFDRNQDSLSYTATNLPAGLAIDNDGVLNGNVNEVGTFNVEISASDGEFATSVSFTITVNENLTPPEPENQSSGGGGSLYYLIAPVFLISVWRRIRRKHLV